MSATRTAQARREINQELTAAIAAKVTSGTVVTSVGKFAAFTIKYITFSDDNIGTKINILGNENWNAANAASALLSKWELTR